MNIIIGNIIVFIASLMMVGEGLIKEKKNILKMQCLYLSLFGVANLFLGGITGAIVNFLSVGRNVLYHFNKFNNLAKIVFVITQIILGILFNNLGFIGFLPIIACVSYTLSLNINNNKFFKIITIIILIEWVIYDLAVNSYVAAAFDGFSILTNFIGIFRIAKDESK